MKIEASARTNDVGRVKAVQRALSILDAFSVSEHTLNLKQISQRVRLDGATTLRMINTMLEAELLHREGDSYSLGFHILELAQISLARFDIRDVALPFMRTIKSEIDETVLLCVQSGNFRVPICQVESAKLYRRTGGIGRPTLLHTGAPGRILLAFADKEFIDSYFIKVVKDTDDVFGANESKFRRLLSTSRRLGYAESENETGSGGAAVASPIYNYDGQIVASLAVAAPVPRWLPVRENARRLVVDGAQKISRKLGFGAMAANRAE